jgi:hypothetical protein
MVTLLIISLKDTNKIYFNSTTFSLSQTNLKIKTKVYILSKTNTEIYTFYTIF